MRENKNREYYSLTLMIVSGTLICLLSGMLFFGLKVFKIGNVSFQFTAYGILGSTSFSLLIFKRFRDVLFVVILLFVINTILTKGKFLLTHVFFFSSVVFSIYSFSSYFYNKLKDIKLARPLVLSGIFSISYVISTVIVAFLSQTEPQKFSTLMNMPIGFLIGFGLGVGFELGEYLSLKKFNG